MRRERELPVLVTTQIFCSVLTAFCELSEPKTALQEEGSTVSSLSEFAVPVLLD